ncbi:hypothetical protein GCM10027296_34470 [Chitinimonas naiadis]
MGGEDCDAAEAGMADSMDSELTVNVFARRFAERVPRLCSGFCLAWARAMRAHASDYCNASIGCSAIARRTCRKAARPVISKIATQPSPRARTGPAVMLTQYSRTRS